MTLIPTGSASGSAILGTLTTYTVTSPAAGADWTQTVPADVVWYPLAAQALLATSASVASRSPHLLITPSGGPGLYYPATAILTASQSAIYIWWRGITVLTQSGKDAGVMPNVPLAAGDALASSTTNIQSGDQWSAITLRVLEVPAGAASAVMLP